MENRRTKENNSGYYILSPKKWDTRDKIKSLGNESGTDRTSSSQRNIQSMEKKSRKKQGWRLERGRLPDTSVIYHTGRLVTRQPDELTRLFSAKFSKKAREGQTITDPRPFLWYKVFRENFQKEMGRGDTDSTSLYSQWPLRVSISAPLKEPLGLGVLLMIESLPTMGETLAFIPITWASGKLKNNNKEKKFGHLHITMGTCIGTLL